MMWVLRLVWTLSARCLQIHQLLGEFSKRNNGQQFTGGAGEYQQLAGLASSLTGSSMSTSMLEKLWVFCSGVPCTYSRVERLTHLAVYCAQGQLEAWGHDVI